MDFLTPIFASLRKSICLLWVILATAACERTFDIDLPAYTSQPVLYAMLEPGQTPLVALHQSQAIADTTDFAALDDATVTLTVPGLAPQTYRSLGDGLYEPLAGWTPQTGDLVSIVATIPGGPVLSVEPVSIPAPAAIISANFTDSALTTANGGESDGLLEIVVRDPAAQANYYQVRIMGVKDSLLEPVTSLPLSGVGLEGTTCSFNGTFFDDRCHDGQEWTWRWRVTPRFYDVDTRTRVPFDRLEVSVAAISESWYRFLESSTNQSENAFFLPGRPVYSNVAQGLGVVGARTDSVLVFPL
ncbi:MAG: hypothetical protein OHK0039_39930 [Bacteroidia bacterium]